MHSILRDKYRFKWMRTYLTQQQQQLKKKKRYQLAVARCPYTIINDKIFKKARSMYVGYADGFNWENKSAKKAQIYTVQQGGFIRHLMRPVSHLHVEGSMDDDVFVFMHTKLLIDVFWVRITIKCRMSRIPNEFVNALLPPSPSVPCIYLTFKQNDSFAEFVIWMWFKLDASLYSMCQIT